MIHLKSISIHQKLKGRGYPFNLPLIQECKELLLESPVVIFVGENGSGKSTILEGLAAAVGLPAVGGSSIDSDKTLEHARDLSKVMKPVWTRKTKRGFFLRAEDFFNFARRMNRTREEMEEIHKEFEGKEGLGWDIARGAVMGQREGIVRRYGADLDARSHGESFLKLFQSRFVPEGLYLLDEPEAPLSPQRQLSLISMIKEMTREQSSQFIMATHSPILMGFPGAQIISFDELPPRAVEYDDVEQVRLTRDFLTNKDAFLRHL